MNVELRKYSLHLEHHFLTHQGWKRRSIVGELLRSLSRLHRMSGVTPHHWMQSQAKHELWYRLKRYLRPLARRAPMSCQLRRPPPVTSQPTQKLGSSFQSISAQWRFAVGVKSAVRLSCVLWFGCTINSSLGKHHRRSGCGRSCGRLQIICLGPAADADTFSMQSKLDIRPKLHKAVFDVGFNT